MKFGELAAKIQAAEEGPARELAEVLVDLMRDYFEACKEANDAFMKAGPRPAMGDRGTAREKWLSQGNELQRKAGLIEHLVIRLAGPIEALL